MRRFVQLQIAEVDSGEHDAKVFFSGMKLDSRIINIETEEIVKQPTSDKKPPPEGRRDSAILI